MALYLSRALVAHVKPEPQVAKVWKCLFPSSLCELAITTGIFQMKTSAAVQDAGGQGAPLMLKAGPETTLEGDG